MAYFRCSPANSGGGIDLTNPQVYTRKTLYGAGSSTWVSINTTRRAKAVIVSGIASNGSLMCIDIEKGKAFRYYHPNSGADGFETTDVISNVCQVVSDTMIKLKREWHGTSTTSTDSLIAIF